MYKPKPGLRGIIVEWTINILVLLFGMTNLVQAFVIPSGSMEDTLLVGDHLLVDKLAYAPADSFSSMFLPYQEVKRGDIIVFRKPNELDMTLVKRAIGLPGDRVRIVDKQLWINGRSSTTIGTTSRRPRPSAIIPAT
jgi:signal peptidase I